MDTENRTDMQAVIDAARAGVNPVHLNRSHEQSLVFAPLGNDGNGRVLDLEKHLLKPHRKRGAITVYDAASFNIVLADNADAGDICIYLDRDLSRPAITAVMNDHGKTGAGWRDFRCEIGFRETPQWLRWRAMDGKMLRQADFAEFIEDNLADIESPPGAQMLEIVTYLQATRTVNFKSAVRLSNGQVQFQNSDDIDAKVGPGMIAVPETFTLALAPLLGCPSYRVPARFRYRLQDGKLMLGFKLQRIEDLMSELINDVVAKIERGANISMLEGKAPSVVSAAD